jgi:hypothetical protein
MSFLGEWLGWGKKKSKKTPAEKAERRAPTLGAGAGAAQGGEIKVKVQREVCAILARSASMDELILHQTVNRLYADVLYDVMAGGAPGSADPAPQVLDWAREAMETWGEDKTGLGEEVLREMAALRESILAALDAASRDPTLRKAAEERLKASGRLSVED